MSLNPEPTGELAFKPLIKGNYRTNIPKGIGDIKCLKRSRQPSRPALAPFQNIYRTSGSFQPPMIKRKPTPTAQLHIHRDSIDITSPQVVFKPITTSKNARKKERRKAQKRAVKAAAKRRDPMLPVKEIKTLQAVQPSNDTHPPIEDDEEYDPRVLPLTIEFLTDSEGDIRMKDRGMDCLVHTGEMDSAANDHAVYSPDLIVPVDDTESEIEIHDDISTPLPGYDSDDALFPANNQKADVETGLYSSLTSPIPVFERRSLAATAHAEIYDAMGGSPVFRRVLADLGLKLEVALRAAGDKESSRYLFRDFAGHFAQAIDRFCGATPHDIPEPASWMMPMVLPWLRPSELPIGSDSEAFTEVCGWFPTLCKLIGGAEMLQSSAWDALTDALTSASISVGSSALRASQTILNAAPLTYDAVCKVVLLRHVTMDFDSSTLVEFRRRRLHLFRTLLNKADVIAYDCEDEGFDATPEFAQILSECVREISRCRASETDMEAYKHASELAESVQNIQLRMKFVKPSPMATSALRRFSVYSLRTLRTKYSPSETHGTSQISPALEATSSKHLSRHSLRHAFHSLFHWRKHAPIDDKGIEDQEVAAVPNASATATAISHATRRFAMLSVNTIR